MDSENRDPARERIAAIVKALARHRSRLARKLEGLRGDLNEAERGEEYRRFGETLLTYIHQVSARAARVVLPDPAEPGRNLDIPLDPSLKPQANAARYFKRAAKSERGLAEVPPRLAAVEAELRSLEHLIERARRTEEHAPLPDGGSVAQVVGHALDDELEAAYRKIPAIHRREALPRAAGTTASTTPRAAAGVTSGAARGRGADRAPSGRLQPRRLKSKEGWDVLIGRNNEGNDYLTHHLARPEDYWFHVHGAAGSHVVLRRGKGKNEPSKQTIEEVCSWAAFYSQARTAGKVPVIVTRKKYVRKPRKAPPGLALCEREKTVMVRPQEPPRSSLQESSDVGVE